MNKMATSVDLPISKDGVVSPPCPKTELIL